MSIEYFVEGKVTSQTEGNQLNYSKGNIEYNTSKNFNQKGNEAGVSLNSPDAIHPDDTPVNLVEVSLNLFFDGTQNNKTNTQLGKDYSKSNHQNDSYTNDFSNVARGYDAVDPTAENQVATYIEGIGTEDDKSESIPFTTKPNNRGIPLGTGPRGIVAKVIKGCKKGAEALKNYAGRDIHLKVNVYGFSRGSAAARHFLHIATNSIQVLETSSGLKVLAPFDEDPFTSAVVIPNRDPLTDSNGYFGACMLYWNLIPKRITFNFVGLYDTVASYGLNHRGGYGIPNDTVQLNLNSFSRVSYILQITSGDEYRDNFDLTNINSAGIYGFELTFPGVHSDIGGGYVSGNSEITDIFKNFGLAGSQGCKQFTEILENEGWYREGQLKVNYTPRTSKYGELKGAGQSVLQGTRAPKNDFDKIPLNTMFHYSAFFNVKYKNTAKKDHEITDPFMQRFNSQIWGYINACNSLRETYRREYLRSNSAGDYISRIKTLSYIDFVDLDDLKTLRNEFLHWSANVSEFGYAPRVTDVAIGNERSRFIQNG